jgi:hypothetical protein|tara:strand:- start:2451 stop:3365 length:915 start_codon:yes stop_codon:yes gene_type:complete
MNKINIDEISAMAGGAVEGAANNSSQKRKKISMPEGYYTNRDQFLEELRLRKVVQEIIKDVRKQNIITENKEVNEEQKLRQLIRTLIVEAKKDLEDTPYSSTAINLLEDLLKQILPNLESEYKTLTTAKAQRDSFRAHLVNAVSNLIETEKINKAGGEAAVEDELLDLDEAELEEDVDLKVSDVDAGAEEKFIDIESEPQVEEEPEEEDNFGLEGQDETGRALAKEAFNNIEKNIAETYAILHDERDEELFEDYLVTNLKLYFDKWEEELGTVVEPTTDEYETERTEDQLDIEDTSELDSEFNQ